MLRDAEGGTTTVLSQTKKLGNTATAIEHIQRAVSLEPNNMQYRQFMQIIENGGSWYSDMGDIYGRPSGRAASAAVC